MGLIFVVALGGMVAGFVQGLSGFAFGLVAMSFWAWYLDPRLAAALAVSGALTGQILAAVSVRRKVDLGVLWPFLLGGLAGIPIGLTVLPHLDTQWFKTVLGVLMLVWCPTMLFAKRLPHIRNGGRFADGVAGMSGGIMSGIGGFAGSLPTLWCMLRGYEKDRQRSVIQNFNLAMLSVTLVGYIAKGVVNRTMIPLFLVVVAAMLVPTLIGTRLYSGLSEAAFKKIVLVLLMLSGLALLASSLPHLIHENR